MATVTGYQSGSPFPLEIYYVDGVWLAKGAAFAYYSMALDAYKAGVRLRPGTGWRSNEYQTELYNLSPEEKIARGVGARVAKPGFSNHQSGRAIDFKRVQDDGQYGWLLGNAFRYGFSQTVASEPWHWEWRG